MVGKAKQKVEQLEEQLHQARWVADCYVEIFKD